MTYALGILIFASAWCQGFSVLFRDGMILEKAGIFLDEYLSNTINKPLWKCPICLASVHGTAIYALFLMPLYGIWLWIPFCVCLCGLNFFCTQFYND